MRDNSERLRDILDAIEKIEKHTVEGQVALEQNELIQVWVIHYIQIIGEATRALSQDLKDSHPEINWRQIIGMRNVLVHGYFNIDATLVWQAVERDLPDLKPKIEAILKELEGTP